MEKKYTLKQKREWCETYLRGEHVPTPLGARRPTFVRELRDWARKYEIFGDSAIDPDTRKKYSLSLMTAAASAVVLGRLSIKEAARLYGVKDKRTVRLWARKYREGGPDALESRRQKESRHDEKKRVDGGAQMPDRGAGEAPQPVRARERLSKKLAVLGRAAGIEPRNDDKARAIQETRKEFPKAKLRDLLEIAGIGKSSYLYCLKKRGKDTKNAKIIKKIRKIFKKSKSTYGVRRVAAKLRNAGYRISNAKVNRLMRKLGLRGKTPERKRYNSFKGGEGKHGVYQFLWTNRRLEERRNVSPSKGKSQSDPREAGGDAHPHFVFKPRLKPYAGFAINLDTGLEDDEDGHGCFL